MRSYSILLQGLHEDALSALSSWLGEASPGARLSHYDAFSAPARIGLANQGAIELIDPRTVVCVEGSRNYSIFHVAKGKSYTVSYSLGRFEGHLPPAYFMRVHKRFIVNLYEVVRYVKKDGGALLLSNNMEVPLSPTKRKDLLDWIQRGGIIDTNGGDKNGDGEW